jgi:hypothetical protein
MWRKLGLDLETGFGNWKLGAGFGNHWKRKLGLGSFETGALCKLVAGFGNWALETGKEATSHL